MQVFQRVDTRDSFHTEEQKPVRALPAVLLIPSILFFLSRFGLIWVNEAEFTDAYQLLIWTFDHPVRWHPLYPILIKPVTALLEPVLAGRVLAILSGFGAMIALSRIANLLYGRREAEMVCWLYIVSPLFYWGNLKVLTESTFQLFCCWSVYFLLVSFKEEKPSAAANFVLMSGLSYLTRPEGILFLLPAAIVIFRFRTGLKLMYLGSLVPWILGFLWSFAVHSSDSYTGIIWSDLPKFRWDLSILRLVSYAEVYPYLFFYPLFILALLNIFRMPVNSLWRNILICVHCMFAGILFIHSAWTTRFLFIPISLLMVEASAGITQVKRWLRWLTVSGCLAFSLAGVFLQREMFSDFKHAALAVNGKFLERRVVSDEIAKTEYYLGRPVVVFKETDLRAGDILILHSYNTDLQREREFLDQNHRYTPLFSVESSTVPLLGNTALANLESTNSPLALLQRFQRQRFQSVVVRIDE